MISVLIVYAVGILLGVILSLIIAGGVPSKRTREKAGIFIKSYGRYYKIHSYVLGAIVFIMGLAVLLLSYAFSLQPLNVAGITVLSLGIGMVLGDMPNFAADMSFRIRHRY